ncbi:MAG: UpxY family transcription antiterminator, partial [Candidatus Tectimicrobiota bacterium]
MNVVLIGFKGSGKTTVGRALARRLERSFVDLDHAVEERYASRTGERLGFREIFRTLGAEAFRHLEAEVAADLLASSSGQVIALGGGAPLISEPVRRQIAQEWVVYLTAEKEALFARILAEGLPAFFDPSDPRASFEALLAEREPVYRALATVTVETTDRAPTEVVDELVARLPEGLSPPQAPSNPALRWYALRTKSRHEQKVTDRLVSKDFHVFLPLIEVWSRRKDRKKLINRPMFPGYLFVECELTKDAWIEIVKTPGVANLLGYAGKPVPVPEEQVSSIQKVVDSGVHVRYHQYLNAGDRVQVVDGPLKGAEGIMMGANEKRQRLVISVDLLNR